MENGDANSKSNNKGPLERLQKKLYLKGSILPKPKRSRLGGRDGGVPSEWQQEEPKEYSSPSPEKRMSLVKKIFFGSIIFFVAAAGVFAIVFLRESNVVSPENVEILISGPVSVEAGKELSLQVIIENKNTVPLESTRLIAQYPEGTRDVFNVEKELREVRRPLEAIQAGGLFKTNERAILFGQEGEKKDVHITLEYRIRGSNAIFVAEKKYEVHISASPIRLSAETPKEANSGKEFSFDIKVLSNSNNVLHDLMVTVEYPFGFSFVESVPRPAYGKSTWVVGDLPAGAERVITIRGIVEGQDEEEKIFRIASGIPSTSDNRTIGVAYASLVEGVEISRPFLAISLFFDGQAKKEYVIGSRQKVDVRVAWTNNLPTKVVDARIEAQLGGVALDKNSVEVSSGFYRSFDNTIIWDGGTLQDLSEIESGGRGSASFRFAPVSLFTKGDVVENPQIDITIDARAKRISETGVPEEIRSSAEGSVKVQSETAFTQRSVYFSGPFQNTGPLPPQAEKETTYTIVWTFVNSSNPISGGVATATLPPYVRWVGKTSPSGEEIAYIERGRIIRWAPGSIARGAGITAPPREAAFQVAFLPGVGQIGQSPELISPVEFSGTDQFTNTTIKSIAKSATTDLSTDPQFERGMERVDP